MKKITFKNIYLLLIISIGLISLGVGSTFAMFTHSESIDNPISLKSNLSFEENVFEFFDVSVDANSSCDIQFVLNNTNSIDDLKYATWYIYEGGEDDISFTLNENSINFNGQLDINGGTININVTNETNKDISFTMGVSISSDVLVLPGYMKLVDDNSEGSDSGTTTSYIASEYITNLYINADKSTVENNSITYNTAPSVSLMNDRLGGTTTSLDGGNIRYYGASPNNYIYFNCSDYSNQTNSTCELWRIIGVFDGKLKIMRNESIGEYSWDTSASTVNSGYGINEWSQADLMKLLNPGYTSESVGGSLYYNSSSGTCYSEFSNSTTSCDFTSAGIKNDATRNKIAMVTWNTGGWNDYSVYSNLIYEKERGTTVVVPGTTCSGTYCNDTVTRQTTWSGKIALPYPSDYGYATDFSQCSETLYNYNSSNDSYACRSNDWMYPILGTSSSGWLLAPRSGFAYYVWFVVSAGFVYDNYLAFYAYGVAPVLYLGSDEVLESGHDGSNSDPYRLG